MTGDRQWCLEIVVKGIAPIKCLIKCPRESIYFLAEISYKNRCQMWWIGFCLLDVCIFLLCIFVSWIFFFLIARHKIYSWIVEISIYSPFCILSITLSSKSISNACVCNVVNLLDNKTHLFYHLHHDLENCGQRNSFAFWRLWSSWVLFSPMKPSICFLPKFPIHFRKWHPPNKGTFFVK